MARYVLMGIDECGQDFNAGGKYFASEEEAYSALDEARESYPEARSLFVEPLYSDLAWERASSEDFDWESWEDQ